MAKQYQISLDKKTYDAIQKLSKQREVDISTMLRIAMLEFSQPVKKIYDLKDKLEFGQYRGEKLVDVIKVNPRYIQWCITKGKNLAFTQEVVDFLFPKANPDTGEGSQ